MKLFITKITVLLLLTVSLNACAQSTKTEDGSKVISLISSEELSAKLGDIQLVDVRTPKEYTSGHLRNAINIDYYDSNFAVDMAKLDKNKTLYIYCRSGGRSGSAAKKLKDMGFTKVYDLKGGIIKWNKAKLEIIK